MQAQREKTLGEFRRDAQFLVATNVAARGLDITGISNVINYDTPSDPFVYVHRVGRSARMGSDGAAFSIVSPADMVLIHEIERSVKISMKRIELDGQITQKVSREMADFRPIRSEGRKNPTGNRFDRDRFSENRRSPGKNERFRRRPGDNHRSNSFGRPYGKS